MNEQKPELLKGAFGELLVQCRLLLHSVQAAPPIKDTGNDLIAVCGSRFTAVQVKARVPNPHFTFDHAQLMGRKFHILAMVWIHDFALSLDKKHVTVGLDRCNIFLLTKEQITKGTYSFEELRPFLMTDVRVAELFYPEDQALEEAAVG